MDRAASGVVEDDLVDLDIPPIREYPLTGAQEAFELAAGGMGNNIRVILKPRER